jgi:hypothetical protein
MVVGPSAEASLGRLNLLSATTLTAFVALSLANVRFAPETTRKQLAVSGSILEENTLRIFCWASAGRCPTRLSNGRRLEERPFRHITRRDLCRDPTQVFLHPLNARGPLTNELPRT